MKVVSREVVSREVVEFIMLSQALCLMYTIIYDKILRALTLAQMFFVNNQPGRVNAFSAM